MLYITKIFQWITNLITSDFSINNNNNNVKKRHNSTIFNLGGSHNRFNQNEIHYDSEEYTFKKKKKN